MFLVGIVLFTLASVAAGLSANGQALIGARFVQGVGAAMILPATLSTVNALFTGKQRAIAFAVWGSTIGGMAALGPLVGGWLTTYYTWRWAFWINIPIGLLVLAGILWSVPETRDEKARPGLDLVGVTLSALGLGPSCSPSSRARTTGGGASPTAASPRSRSPWPLASCSCGASW